MLNVCDDIRTETIVRRLVKPLYRESLWQRAIVDKVHGFECLPTHSEGDPEEFLVPHSVIHKSIFTGPTLM